MFAVYHNNPILLFRSNSQKVYCKKAILKSLPRGFATITILNNNFFWSTCEQLLWSFISYTAIFIKFKTTISDITFHLYMKRAIKL